MVWWQVYRQLADEDSRCKSYMPDVTRIVVLNKARAMFLETHYALIVRKYVLLEPWESFEACRGRQCQGQRVA